MKKLIKCIVTGGAGFIGSHLCDALVGKGYYVYCLDNLITGNKKNISQLVKYKNFLFIHYDICKPIISDSLLKQFGDVSYIYHLASPASPKKYRKYAIETMCVNSTGTHNLLSLTKKIKAKFLFTSTSEVYGNPLEHPQKENYFGNVNPVGIRACYDESKRFGEALIMEYYRKFDLNIRIVRIFNTYGPRMDCDDGRVIVNFINQAISSKPLTIFGDGSQTRSFCFVSDMVRGLISAMEKERTCGRVINLGYPKEYKVKDIAGMIIKKTGSSSKLIFLSKQEDDPEMREPDITLARKLLGWQPLVSLDSGLKQTMDYYKAL